MDLRAIRTVETKSVVRGKRLCLRREPRAALIYIKVERTLTKLLREDQTSQLTLMIGVIKMSVDMYEKER